jgi:adenylate cyclase class 2
MKDREIEVKLWVKNLALIESRLKQKGAILLQPRTFEQNLRFDTSDRSLTQSGQVLRLRRDLHNLLTFKGASTDEQGARSRLEIQTRVEDFHTARRLLEALGFTVILTYEKFRSEYDFEQGRVSLDEMPYGNFLEIEAESANQIQKICQSLNLDWNKRIRYSYGELFTLIREMDHLESEDLTFQAFQNWKGNLARLGIFPADFVDFEGKDSPHE